MRNKQAPKAASKKRAVLVGLVGLIVVGLAATMFWAPYGRIAETKATLQISMSGWNPARIRAKVGQPVVVTMINLDNRFHTDGGGWHGFTVPAFGVDEKVGPKRTSTFTFTPTKVGKYVFYCEICCGGKENPFMRGKLIVS